MSGITENVASWSRNNYLPHVTLYEHIKAAEQQTAIR